MLVIMVSALTPAGDPPECAAALTGTQVYLFGPLTQTDTADQIRNLTAQITSLVATVFPKCAELALPFACKNAFPKCVMVNDTAGDGAHPRHIGDFDLCCVKSLHHALLVLRL